MLVIARREGEEVEIADIIQIRVLSVTGKIVRLGIQAPREISVRRKEQVIEVPVEKVPSFLKK